MIKTICDSIFGPSGHFTFMTDISGNTFIIQVAGNPGLVVDIKGGNKGDKGEFIIWSPNNQPNQRFRIDGKTITAVHSGKVLDACGGLRAGAGAIQFGPHGGANQQWVYNPDTKEIRSASQNLVLEVDGGRLSPGTGLKIGSPNGGPGQKWDLILANPSAGPLRGIYRIQVASNPGLVLDIKGAGKNEGANVILWSPNGGANQKFRFEGESIFPVHSGKALDASGGLKQGAALIQWGPHNGPNQKWVYDPTTQEIQSTSQNLVFDAKGGSLSPGTDIIIWPKNNGPNQKFLLVVA
jgi:hypothetical protein